MIIGINTRNKEVLRLFISADKTDLSTNTALLANQQVQEDDPNTGWYHVETHSAKDDITSDGNVTNSQMTPSVAGSRYGLISAFEGQMGSPMGISNQ